MTSDYTKNSPLDLALRYMDIFFSGENMERLHELFGDKFRFRGPLHTFDTAADYIQALAADPPVNCEYSIIKALQSGSTACLIYQFQKGDVSTPMAQLFEIEQQKIVDVLLLFDSAACAN